MNKNSYSSADISIPVKILHDLELIKGMKNHKHILLRHLQLSVTNKCNLKCRYCSCSDVDRQLELDIERIFIILQKAKQAGCISITITGGGETLLHSKINEIIRECKRLGILVGFVTNGILLNRLEEDVGWCRISFDSDRVFSSEFANGIEKTAKRLSKTDWAFSFVIIDDSLKNDFGDLKRLVKFANASNFTHVRVVVDIFHPDESLIVQARSILKGIDGRVFYQARNHSTKGTKRCWVSLLKPTIGTDGNIYPCCGVQYAINSSKKDFNPKMSMGRGEDIVDIIERQDCFDGSVCDVCYYQGYNNVLSLLLKDIEHKEWL